MSITQLNPQIPLDTDLGPGRAVLVIDYSEEQHLYWVVILDKDGSIWTLDNTRVRGQKNAPINRNIEEKPDVLKETLKLYRHM